MLTIIVTISDRPCTGFSSQERAESCAFPCYHSAENMQLSPCQLENPLHEIVEKRPKVAVLMSLWDRVRIMGIFWFWHLQGLRMSKQCESFLRLGLSTQFVIEIQRRRHWTGMLSFEYVSSCRLSVCSALLSRGLSMRPCWLWQSPSMRHRFSVFLSSFPINTAIHSS